jgi:uncharacterized protein (TIGR03435 family)
MRHGIALTAVGAAALVAFTNMLVRAQAPASPAFEVASVRPSPEQLGPAAYASVGVHISGAQVRISYLALRDYLSIAYRLPVGQVEGPDWIAQVRFDIAAKLPDGSSASQVPEMLQALLADRFLLKTHRESKDFPVYALIVAKGGPKLRDHVTAGDPAAVAGTVNVTASGGGNGAAIDLGGGSTFSMSDNRVEITKANMTAIASMLTRLIDRPVIDATGLTGIYDLALTFAPEDFIAAELRSAVNAGVTLPPQAQAMLDSGPSDPLSAPLLEFGLRLESRKAPLDVIVVDAMRKTPIEN